MDEDDSFQPTQVPRERAVGVIEQPPPTAIPPRPPSVVTPPSGVPTQTAVSPQGVVTAPSPPVAPASTVAAQPSPVKPASRETLQLAPPVPGVALPFSAAPQESRQVPADMTCSGDVVVNGERWFDSDAATALIVYFQQPAQVLGPWGFSCMPGDQRSEECSRKRQYEGFRSCQPNNVYPR